MNELFAWKQIDEYTQTTTTENATYTIRKAGHTEKPIFWVDVELGSELRQANFNTEEEAKAFVWGVEVGCEYYRS